jgi:hypothetical protein
MSLCYLTQCWENRRCDRGTGASVDRSGQRLLSTTTACLLRSARYFLYLEMLQVSVASDRSLVLQLNGWVMQYCRTHCSRMLWTYVHVRSVNTNFVHENLGYARSWMKFIYTPRTYYRTRN